MAIESINPATGEKLESYSEMPRGAVDDTHRPGPRSLPGLAADAVR